MPDPAFVMSPSPCDSALPDTEARSDFVAVSLSALMARYVTNGDEARWGKLCVEIVRSVQRVTGLPVVLVPHTSSDYEFMRGAFHTSLGDEVTIIEEDVDARQAKWIIGRAKLVIASRTHAAIAALSTGVPTISLGYSVKARGINEMVFGHQEYVLYGEEVTAGAISERVEGLCQDYADVRGALEKKARELERDAGDAGRRLVAYLRARSES